MDCTVLKTSSNEFKGNVYYKAQIILTSGDVVSVPMAEAGCVRKDDSGKATFRFSQGYNMTPKVTIVGFE